jgi:hypothetical protein
MHEGDLNLTDSDELLLGKMLDSRLPRLPLLNTLLGNEIHNEAHLLGHSKVSGTAYSNGARDRWI